jgi:hypothetical protein
MIPTNLMRFTPHRLSTSMVAVAEPPVASMGSRIRHTDTAARWQLVIVLHRFEGLLIAVDADVPLLRRMASTPTRLPTMPSPARRMGTRPIFSFKIEPLIFSEEWLLQRETVPDPGWLRRSAARRSRGSARETSWAPYPCHVTFASLCLIRGCCDTKTFSIDCISIRIISYKPI